ncbi:sulfite exporter TauE/SafE family protein [Pararhodobacter zhoushanensis]|uniref:Probable membrane transporter protein n=1 Tax=Pararhodobacter zhoushanensis TaxID=2479545 RepID=A0ABT3GXF4_9RHOB|nr:sulfite exporter TauE/SafE family protein [Pararhodobacter zhoushanensis]MCW1932224.1 sulfite exporter TauE/SafE family protein [Pararhodobacter zhoushanensis]
MDLIAPYLPPDVTLAVALALMATSFIASFITISLGIGGGGLMLAVMASLLPPLALVPVHGVVQFGSNAGRTAMMARYIRWSAVWGFGAGIILGIAIGASLVISIPPSVVLIGVGLFLIWTVLARPPAWMRDWPLVTGTVTSILSMVFGASGPFVNTYVKSLDMDRHSHVATAASLLTLQHLLKSVAFGVLGFAYAVWAPLIAALILCGLAGTWTGKRVLNRLTDARFKQALDIILFLLALQLIWSGIEPLL